MAFNARTSWEVRTTGSDANGGGFNTLATGTDFSQQDSPQVVFTDIVIGATNTQITSVAHPFVAADVGNVINITGGTGFTVQRVQIVSVSGVIATCDKAVGTVASTGGAGNLGGGFATVAAAAALVVAGNDIWIKAGTYNLTATVAIIAATQNIVGYQTTHGDNGTKPVINMTTNSLPIFNIANASSFFWIQNISFTTSATTKSSGITNVAGSNRISIADCSFAGFTNALSLTSEGLFLYNTSIIGCTSAAINYSPSQTDSGMNIGSCYIYGSGAAGISFSGGISFVNITGSVIAGSTGFGVDTSNFQGRLIVTNSTIANNAGGGIRLSGTWQGSTTFGNTLILRSSIIYGNTGFGVLAPNTSGGGNASIASNALGANSSGNYSNVGPGLGDIALTVSPFNGTTDFSLNGTAGGGFLCKGAGFPGSFPGGTTTGHLDIGAVQSSGSGSLANYGYTG